MGTGHVGTFCLARTKVSVSQKESRYLAQAILFHKYFGHSMPFLWASQMVNNLTANAGDKKCRFDPWVKKIPWRRAWQPIPVFASKEFHEQRSPVGYSPYGHKEVATTEATWHAHTHTCHSYGEKNPPEICFQTPAWGQICTFQVITYESLYFFILHMRMCRFSDNNFFTSYHPSNKQGLVF